MSSVNKRIQNWVNAYLDSRGFNCVTVDEDGEEHYDASAREHLKNAIEDALLEFVLPSRSIEHLRAEVDGLRRSLANQWDAYQVIAHRVDAALPTMATGGKESKAKTDTRKKEHTNAEKELIRILEKFLGQNGDLDKGDKPA